MVWFQCEDCGENLKKPKLASHFNRCSAHKLSCIDCGVIFDQQSVQAHTSCVSEVEKYGPKGVSKPVNPSGKPKKAQNGPEVDLTRGLTQRPPWSCTLCNVKATSRETLELHAQGKKHRAKAKAATLKEVPPVDTKDVTGSKLAPEEVVDDRLSKSSLEASNSVEKKRKNELVDSAGEGEEDPRSQKKEKKSKKESVNSEPQEVSPDSPGKKRKHEEAEQEKVTDGKDDRKKSKKKDKTSTSAVEEENGHAPDEEPMATNGEKKNKEKKGKKAKTESPDQNDNHKVVDGNRKHETLVNGNHETEKNGKKAKKAKASGSTLEEAAIPEPVETPEDGKSKSEKKKRKKSGDRTGTPDETPGKEKEKESLVHEVSFREWLEDDDGNGSGGTPTHPPIVDKLGEDRLPIEPRNLDREQQSRAVSKVVKWKKIISEALGKSPDGRMKKKDLSKAVLSVALKAAEASSVPLDKIVLKEELMRQIQSNPKFVLDGKHVRLASAAK